MRYDVSLFRSENSEGPEIRTQVEAADPSAACLAVMGQFGLTYAFMVLVFVQPGALLVGEFMEVDVSFQDHSPSAADLLLAIDYGM